MFLPSRRQKVPFFIKNHIGSNPMGFNPFEYHNHFYQEENPFRRDFLMPQQQPQQYQQQQPFQQQMPQQQMPFQHQAFNHPFFQGNSVLQNQSMKGIPSMFKDQNGKLDLMKMGNGVSNLMGMVNQAGPIMKMLGGFFK